MQRHASNPGAASPKIARIITLALLAGIVFFAAVVIGLIESGTLTVDGADRNEDDLLHEILPLAGPMLLLVTAPMAFLLRSQMLKRSDDLEDPVKAAQPYVAASVLFMALLEAPALLGIVTTLITGGYFPNMIAPALAIAIAVANLPGQRHFESRRELRGL